MAIIPTQQDYDMLQQSTRDLQVKIELLNFNLQTVDTIEGNVIDGSVNIDANQDIRRTCNISLVVTDSSFNIGEGGKIWLDKYIRINIGYTDILTKELKFWNLGLFMINNPTRTYNANTNTLSFEGLDLMAKLTGKRNGQLEALITLIPAGTPIKEAVIGVITQLGGFSNYVIDDTDNVVPYDIKVETSSYVYDILSQLRDLYSNWEMFFDTEGVFNFKRIPDGINNSVVLDFNQLKTKINISDNLDVNFENVKNYIIVYGRLLDDGTQIKSQIGDYFTNSPYNVNKLGKIRYIVEDEKIYTKGLAAERAYYELYLHARMNDAINIEVVPVYWLNDVNVCIYVDNPDVEIQDKYLIKSLSIPLGIDSNMTISAIRVYPTEVIPKPIVNIEPDMATSNNDNKLFLDFYVTGDHETFEINPNTDINWTVPSGYLLSDYLTLDRTSILSSNHIRTIYNSVPSVPGVDWGQFAPLTAQVKEGVSMNIYGIENNLSDICNIGVRTNPYNIRVGYQLDYSKLIQVGNTFTIKAYAYADSPVYMQAITTLTANDFIYNQNIIRIDSITTSSSGYLIIDINCTVIGSGYTEFFVKKDILIDSNLYGYTNGMSKSPYYITAYSNQDLIVSLTTYFLYHNTSSDSFRITATTDIDVDSFEITSDDLEYDSYYYQFDHAEKISNNQIYLFFNNVNEAAIDSQIGWATIKVKEGVAKKDGIPSVPSNISVCVGAAFG